MLKKTFNASITVFIMLKVTSNTTYHVIIILIYI